MEKAIYFYGKGKPYYEFSNFFPSIFTLKGYVWKNVESYFQAHKFYDPTHHDSMEYFHYIQMTNTASKAFYLGRQKKTQYTSLIYIDPSNCMKNMNSVIEEYKHIKPVSRWEEMKDTVMYEAVYAKFSQNTRLKELLLHTKDAVLYEDSPYDEYWGIGKNKHGKNRLGEILTQIRERLREEASSE
jgi:ribA/ribD-fused uncharacterized protein